MAGLWISFWQRAHKTRLQPQRWCVVFVCSQCLNYKGFNGAQPIIIFEMWQGAIIWLKLEWGLWMSLNLPPPPISITVQKLHISFWPSVSASFLLEAVVLIVKDSSHNHFSMWRKSCLFPACGTATHTGSTSLYALGSIIFQHISNPNASW